MALSFNQCQREDLEDLVTLSNNTFIEAFEKDNDPIDFKNYICEAFFTDSIIKQLENPESLFYFAFNGKQLIGYIKINQGAAQTEDFSDQCIELERIYVKSDFQNKGYGKELLNYAIGLARKADQDFIWLGVWQKNTNAVRFYERYGFRKFGTHPYFIGKDKQIDWLMRLDLM